MSAMDFSNQTLVLQEVLFQLNTLSLAVWMKTANSNATGQTAHQHLI